MKRYLGVREWSYSTDALFGSQQHNLNSIYRNSMSHVNSDLTEYNINIDGEITFQEHLNQIKEFNSKQSPKSRNRIEHIREQKRYLYFDKKSNSIIPSSKYRKNNESHIKHTKYDQKWTANKGAIEQVLYFSNTMKDENISRSDWIQLAKNWAIHMKNKFGRTLINAQIHLDEEVPHLHSSFSCLRKKDNVLTYEVPQMTKSGYGSQLQDDFDTVFNETFKDKKLDNSYNRGVKKMPYNEVGNDHTKSKEHREQLDTVNEIIDTVANDDITIIDTLQHIRGLKKIYKGNKEALKILNKFQSGFNKINKETDLLKDKAKELMSIEKTQKKIQNAFADDLDNLEELVNFVKDNKEVANTFIRFGGDRILKTWNIKKEKDKVINIPTPMGTQQRLQSGKLVVGSKMNIKQRIVNLDL